MDTQYIVAWDIEAFSTDPGPVVLPDISKVQE